MIEGQPEPFCDPGLNGVHFGAILGHRFAGLGGGQFGWRAVLVGGAQEQHLVAARTLIAGIKVGGQLAADQVSEVFDPVDIGNGRGDQVTLHNGGLCMGAPRLAAPRRREKTLGRAGQSRSRLRPVSRPTRKDVRGE